MLLSVMCFFFQDKCNQMRIVELTLCLKAFPRDSFRLSAAHESSTHNDM